MRITEDLFAIRKGNGDISNHNVLVSIVYGKRKMVRIEAAGADKGFEFGSGHIAIH